VCIVHFFFLLCYFDLQRGWTETNGGGSLCPPGPPAADIPYPGHKKIAKQTEREKKEKRGERGERERERKGGRKGRKKKERKRKKEKEGEARGDEITM